MTIHGNMPEVLDLAAPVAQVLDADTLNKIGVAHYLRGDFPRAEQMFIAATTKDPECAGAWGNLGLVWQMTGHWDDALKCYMRSMELAPDNPVNLTNLAFLTLENGYEDNAIRLYEKALALRPDYPEARANLSLCLLRRFEFARAWPLAESRFDMLIPVAKRREYPIPLWDGKPVKRLGIWQEQGIGDTILYSTLLPELERREIDFTMEVDPRLIPAYQRAFPQGEFRSSRPEAKVVFPAAADLNEIAKGPFVGCDAHISAGSLPRFFRDTAGDFEAQPKRLFTADPGRVRYYSEVLGFPTIKKKRIAISWRSLHQNPHQMFVKDKKSASLAAFKALGDRKDLQLVDVQYGDTAGERAGCTFGLEHVGGLDLTQDIEGVLALISACDAVVTTCNVTAHFAAALGKPTYVMYLRAIPPLYYYQPHEGTMLWYPSATLITGEAVTTWEEAVRRAGERL